jgi:hypothetical protein
VDGSSFKESLRLALSRREKALTLEEACARDLAADAISEKDYGALKTLYDEQIEIAEGELAALRERARQERGACRNGLLRLESAREKLTRKAADGQIPPQKANRDHRKLQEDARRLEGESHEWGRLLVADSADELGGFTDLPFDQYAGTKRKRISWRGETRPLLGVALVILAVLLGVWAGRLLLNPLSEGGALECTYETDGALGEMVRLNFHNPSGTSLRAVARRG